MGQFETKHTAFNLTYKDHPVFKGKQIIEDSAGDVFLWIDTDSRKVSFGGKYFQIYNEQKLVQAMTNFAYIAADFVQNVNAGKQQDPSLCNQFREALEFAEQVKEWRKPVKFFEIHDPYYALIKAPDQDAAIKVYVERVAEDDGTLHEEIREVDRDYALVSFSKGATEDNETVPIKEILEGFKKEGSAVLLISRELL